MKLKVDILTELKKNIKRKKSKPLNLLNSVFNSLNFRAIEIKLYNLLLKKSLNIDEIKKGMNVSERTIRNYIKRLLEKGFIKRKVLEGKRLKYVYSAVPIEQGWNKVRNEIEEIVKELDKVFT